MSRITDRNDWFNIWFDDKNSMLNTMLRNLVADLEAGYDCFSYSIFKQQVEYGKYKMDFDGQMEEFKYMDDKAVNRWCYYDLKRRGAID